MIRGFNQCRICINAHWPVAALVFNFFRTNINFNLSGTRKILGELGLPGSFPLGRLFVFSCLVGRSAVAAPAGHPLGDIVALADSKFFAQSLVDQLGHVFWNQKLEVV